MRLLCVQRVCKAASATKNTHCGHKFPAALAVSLSERSRQVALPNYPAHETLHSEYRQQYQEEAQHYQNDP